MATNLTVVKHQLGRLGHSVTVASSGRKALEILSVKTFDIVFMDCQMPEMDGYETTRHLRRSNGPNADVPVVALTAAVLSEYRVHREEAGMNDLLTKPTRLEDLSNMLDKWCALPGAAAAEAMG